MLLIRRQRPIGDPAPSQGLDARALAAEATTYYGVAGAGRIVQSLAELGVASEPCHQFVVDLAAPANAIEAVDLGSRFPTVVLGSHIVNVTDASSRAAFLALARRHLAPRGTMLVEHHPIDWSETAADVRAMPGGSAVGMVDVRRDPPFVSAVSVYDVGGRVIRQAFTARVLSDAELADVLSNAGFDDLRRLGPTWLAVRDGDAPRLTE